VAPATGRVRDAVSSGSEALARAGIASPVREARRLLALAAGSSLATMGPEVSAFVGGRYRMLIAARARRVPLPLLEGETGFLDFDVAVRPGVFVPRVETEELAERAVSALRSLSFPPLCLDLGTGTGVLALAMAQARPDVAVVAVDVSPRAVACARRNVRNHGLAARIEVRRSDWFSNVPERFHLIVANPPYVARPDRAKLEPEVRRHDPWRALDGGPDGLSSIRTVLAAAPRHLFSGGTVLVEIGHDQGMAVLQLARAADGWVETRVERDIAGKERFFIGRCG